MGRDLSVANMAIVLPRQLQDDDSPIPFIIPPSLSIMRQYGIAEVNDFTKFLDSNTIVAGSFALASYLIQEGIEVDFEPNDIDIFVSTEKFGGIDNFIDKMTLFMARFRYTLREEGYSGGDYDCDSDDQLPIHSRCRIPLFFMRQLPYLSLDSLRYVRC